MRLYHIGGGGIAVPSTSTGRLVFHSRSKHHPHRRAGGSLLLSDKVGTGTMASNVNIERLRNKLQGAVHQKKKFIHF